MPVIPEYISNASINGDYSHKLFVFIVRK